MTFTFVPSERRVMYSQIGLRLVDEFTGGLALHRVDVRVSFLNGAGAWQPISATPVMSPSGNRLFPGLGRSASVTKTPAVLHRVELISAFYRPDYLRTADALEFEIYPYDDLNPPVVVPDLPLSVMMLPSPAYPFPAYLRVVRGQVIDSGGRPMPDVEVAQGTTERVLSDERGVFALPLRWAALEGHVIIDATDHRTGRTNQLTLTLPQDLLQGQTLVPI